MDTLKIGDRFALPCPEGFHAPSEAEQEKLHLPEGDDSLCLISEEDRMVVSVGWKQVNAFAGLILHLISPVTSMEAGVHQSMAPYGYRRETALTRQIGDRKAEGFRYTYTAGDNPMVGESYVIREGRSLTFFHVYLSAALQEQGLARWNALLDAVTPM